MRDVPIIFSGPMVRSLLAGRKTMTRRLAWRSPRRDIGVLTDPKDREAKPTPWQNVKVGDRLWVRENWLPLDPHHIIDGKQYAYGADTPPGSDGDRIRIDYGYKWRPSIHCPRVASRLTLYVDAVKIERLQDISEDDAKAEGCERAIAGNGEHGAVTTYRTGFVYLWGSLHGTDSWLNNPEVVAVTFSVHRHAA